MALTIPRNAPLLILDEPTSYMDIPSKKALMDILVDWMDRGEHTIIMASHQLEDIRKMADYMCVLRDGKVIGTFEKEELTERYVQYWLKNPLPEAVTPGEVTRKNETIISNRPKVSEEFFRKHSITWIERTTLDLEDIITLLLNEQGEH